MLILPISIRFLPAFGVLLSASDEHHTVVGLLTGFSLVILFDLSIDVHIILVWVHILALW